MVPGLLAASIEQKLWFTAVMQPQKHLRGSESTLLCVHTRSFHYKQDINLVTLVPTLYITPLLQLEEMESNSGARTLVCGAAVPRRRLPPWPFPRAFRLRARVPPSAPTLSEPLWLRTPLCGFGLMRSPPLVLLLHRFGTGNTLFCRQAQPMNPGAAAGRGAPRRRWKRRPRCLRLSSVFGSDPQRGNDLLLLPPAAGERLEPRGLPVDLEPRHQVLYFPGDVQNYHEIMTRHPENYQWESWSLENVATILAHRFPNSYIWVIKCSQIHLHKFSCYDNFVKSNMFGAPEHNTDFGAFKHLYMLLVNAFNLSQNGLLKNVNVWNKDSKASDYRSNSSSNGCQVEKEKTCKRFDESTMSESGSTPSLKGASFTLIGFSKGCVVLNQLLFELKEAKKDKTIDAFIKSIKTMYWLDGGHSGGSNTWVTYPEVLKEFAQTGITVHTHVRSYQVSDPMRSWIGKEHKKFVQILRDFGVQVTSQIHFAKKAPSIENHFRVHEVF
ncbi:mitochondrial protein C2orf69-like [Perognathus longimembris pacificus]|uniref:mitochondrial protein C2orf69-like n=1 Tax=Perognathus longimembris pacificus TaxID=214514 RepID=UPI002018E7F2|nr:mitochondrial protein C2orf69-like [Perognathus longimembris pacificus]